MRFKFLAIRSLANGDAKFLKNLKEGKIYQFYNGYTFKQDTDGEVISIENKSSVLEKLYDVSMKHTKMIKRFILGNYTEEREIHKRPFAKFMQDIGKEVGLIE